MDEFIEDRCEPMPSIKLTAEFVVPASEVLHKRVPGTDPPGRAESFQTPTESEEVGGQHPPDRASANAVPEPGKLALEASVASGGIFLGQSQDQS